MRNQKIIKTNVFNKSAFNNAFNYFRYNRHKCRSSVNFEGKTFLPENTCMKN